MYGWTDIRKFTPLSYRTSALWSNCPKRLTKHFGSSSNAKNTRNAKKAKVFPTNQPTEGPTNSRTVVGYRVTCTGLKMTGKIALCGIFYHLLIGAIAQKKISVKHYMVSDTWCSLNVIISPTYSILWSELWHTTRPDTQQSSRGWLGRSRKAKTTCNLEIFPMYRRTNKASSRVACPQLKIVTC